MERVLITGGAGYLGSVAVGCLLQRGYRVVVLDNLLYGQSSLFQYCDASNFEFVLGDVRDERILRELLKRSDAVLNLAAIVGVKACERDPLTARSVNHESIVTLNRLRSPQQRILFPSTNSGYGTRSDQVH